MLRFLYDLLGAINAGDQRGVEGAKMLLAVGLALAAIILVLGSIVGTMTELRYALFGTSTQATVIRAQLVTQRSRRSARERLEVEWTFSYRGTLATGIQVLPPDHRLPDDGTVAIDWLAGDPPTSRVRGTGSPIPVLVLLAACTGLVVIARRLKRQADADVARSKRG
jgi:hypothetical protein